jgi:hypothetical protein
MKIKYIQHVLNDTSIILACNRFTNYPCIESYTKTLQSDYLEKLIISLSLVTDSNGVYPIYSYLSYLPLTLTIQLPMQLSTNLCHIVPYHAHHLCFFSPLIYMHTHKSDPFIPKLTSSYSATLQVHRHACPYKSHSHILHF